MSRAKTGKKTETPPFCRFLSRNSERNRLPEKRCATLGAAPTRFWKGALDASAATLAPFLQAGDSARHRRAFRQSRRSLTEPPRADKAATFFMPCDGIKGAPRRRRRQYKTARRVGWAPIEATRRRHAPQARATSRRRARSARATPKQDKQTHNSRRDRAPSGRTAGTGAERKKKALQLPSRGLPERRAISPSTTANYTSNGSESAARSRAPRRAVGIGKSSFEIIVIFCHGLNARLLDI